MAIQIPTKQNREPLLDDSRVEGIFARLQQELKFHPDDVGIGSYIQEPRMVERKGGLLVEQPAQAVFIAVGKNPRIYPGLTETQIQAPANTRLDWWREKEDESWRFVGLEDPALPIFRVLIRTVMKFQAGMRELN